MIARVEKGVQHISSFLERSVISSSSSSSSKIEEEEDDTFVFFTFVISVSSFNMLTELGKAVMLG